MLRRRVALRARESTLCADDWLVGILLASLLASLLEIGWQTRLLARQTRLAAVPHCLNLCNCGRSRQAACETPCSGDVAWHNTVTRGR